MPARRELAAVSAIARPLLGVDAQALLAYCHALMLPFAVDPTNARTQARRNAVREALGALRPHFPGLDRAVARAADVLGAERRGQSPGRFAAARSRPVCRRETLRDVDFAHVEAAVSAMEMGRTGTYLMKSGLALRIERGKMHGIVTLPARSRFKT